MKRFIAAVGTFTALLAALFSAPGSVSADTGDRTTTTYIANKSFVVNGVTRAKLRYGKITWGKNTIDGSKWATLSAQIIDTSTDGYCARVRFGFGPNGEAPSATECHGVWTTRRLTISRSNETSSSDWEQVDLYRGSATHLYPRVTWIVYPPRGY